MATFEGVMRQPLNMSGASVYEKWKYPQISIEESEGATGACEESPS